MSLKRFRVKFYFSSLGAGNTDIGRFRCGMSKGSGIASPSLILVGFSGVVGWPAVLGSTFRLESISDLSGGCKVGLFLSPKFCAGFCAGAFSSPGSTCEKSAMMSMII